MAASPDDTDTGSPSTSTNPTTTLINNASYAYNQALADLKEHPDDPAAQLAVQSTAKAYVDAVIASGLINVRSNIGQKLAALSQTLTESLRKNQLEVAKKGADASVDAQGNLLKGEASLMQNEAQALFDMAKSEKSFSNTILGLIEGLARGALVLGLGDPRKMNSLIANCQFQARQLRDGLRMNVAGVRGAKTDIDTTDPQRRMETGSLRGGTGSLPADALDLNRLIGGTLPSLLTGDGSFATDQLRAAINEIAGLTDAQKANLSGIAEQAAGVDGDATKLSQDERVIFMEEARRVLDKNSFTALSDAIKRSFNIERPLLAGSGQPAPA